MRAGNEKYDKLIEILRKSAPLLNSTEDIESEVLRRISKRQLHRFTASDAIDFLFGWIYIGWVRRCLITASVCLLLFFVWQQGVILKQISYLGSQTVINSKEILYNPDGHVQKRFMLYKLSDRRFGTQTVTISEKQMNQLLDSVNMLQIRLKDLENQINSDPDMRKRIEEKLTKDKSLKTNIQDHDKKTY